MHSSSARRIAPCVLLLMAASASVAAPGPATPEAAAWLAAKWASSDLAALASAARRWRDEHATWPADCAEAARTYLQPPPSADPWGSPYTCRRVGDTLWVVSLGADGQQGTPDDISLDARASEDAAVATLAAGAPAAAPAQAMVAPATSEEQATAQALQAIAGALEAFRKKEGRYPVTDKVEHLERWLVSEHLASAAWTSRDAWGRPLRYRTTDIGSSYTLASAGADGRWEALGPESPVPAEGADLAIADGVPVRWPASLLQAPSPAPAAAAPAPPRNPEEQTRQVLERLASLIEKRRQGGRFIESDDAERIARDFGAGSATDGWGRPLHYLSAGGGTKFALVSTGADGRLGASMEAYAQGMPPAGDDVLVGSNTVSASRAAD